MQPKATIMIPAYNAEEFISRSIESALNQTFDGPYEILVVNDGSSDKTREIVDSYTRRYPNVRLLNQENLGQGVARNRLLDESRGEILLGSDADDFLHENALEEIIRFYGNHDDFGFVYTDQDEIGPSGEVVRQRRREGVHGFFGNLIYHCQFAGHVRSFKKALLDGIRFDPKLRTAQDLDFTLKILQSGLKVGHIPKVLYSYFLNEGGISIGSKENVISTSIKLLGRHIAESGLYVKKPFEVVPVNAGNGAIYYDHLVGEKSMMDPAARRVLVDYLLGR